MSKVITILRRLVLGIWDLIINSSSAAVKRNAPDLSFLRETCRSTYDYSWSAVSKIDNTVRVGVVERVNHYLPDEEAKAKIARFAKNAAVYACHEALKCLPLPGVVSIYNIVTQSLRDEKIEDYKEAMKTLQARISRLENESNHYRKLLEESQMLRCDNSIESQNAPCLNSNTNVNQKPDKNRVQNLFRSSELVSSVSCPDAPLPFLFQCRLLITVDPISLSSPFTLLFLSFSVLIALFGPCAIVSGI
ncbi:hypothetical protein ACSBR1_011657 [Camellia fascicularis]